MVEGHQLKTGKALWIGTPVGTCRWQVLSCYEARFGLASKLCGGRFYEDCQRTLDRHCDAGGCRFKDDGLPLHHRMDPFNNKASLNLEDDQALF